MSVSIAFRASPGPEGSKGEAELHAARAGRPDVEHRKLGFT